MSAIRAGLTGAMILGLLLALTVLSGVAAAQTYPPPVGSLTTKATPTTPAPGTTTTVTATVLDSAGKPVAGAPVVFQIDSQPGTDAKFSNGLPQITATTDATGTATVSLSAGGTPGNIIVKTTSGEMTSQVTVQVRSAVGAPPTGGQPPEDSDGGLAVWQAVLIAAGAAVLLSGSIIAARRWRS